MGSSTRASRPEGPDPGSPSAAVDWRLLVPLETGTRVLVGGVAAEEIVASLNRVGADALAWEPGGGGLEQPAPGVGFDVAAVPLGLEKARGDRAEPALRAALAELRERLRPGGTLVLGFSNPATIRRRASGREGFSLRPTRVYRALEETGYESIQLFGALGGLAIPTDIFPLRTEVLAFVVRQRLRRTIPRLLVGVLTAAPALRVAARMLPAYFVTATSVRRPASPLGRPAA